MGTLWIAADIEALEASPRIMRSPSALESVKSEPTKAPKKVKVREVISLIQKNIKFRSRQLKTKSPDAIAAVAGHEVILDTKKLEEKLAQMLGVKSLLKTRLHQSRPT